MHSPFERRAAPKIYLLQKIDYCIQLLRHSFEILAPVPKCNGFQILREEFWHLCQNAMAFRSCGKNFGTCAKMQWPLGLAGRILAPVPKCYGLMPRSRCYGQILREETSATDFLFRLNKKRQIFQEIFKKEGGRPTDFKTRLRSEPVLDCLVSQLYRYKI